MGDDDSLTLLLVIGVGGFVIVLVLYQRCALENPPSFVADILTSIDKTWEAKCRKPSPGPPTTPRAALPYKNLRPGVVDLSSDIRVERAPGADSFESCALQCSQNSSPSVRWNKESRRCVCYGRE